ncbi:transmembrane protein 151B-like [Styela clava]
MCTVGPSVGTISPVHRPLLLCAFRKKYWKCLLLSAFIYICLTASLSCWFYNSNNPNSGCTRTHSFIPLSLLMMFYVIYLIECWRNSPHIMPFVSREYVHQHIHLIRHAAPVIWWRVISYHFARRSRQIVRYRNGISTTTTQVYYERTNSHVDEQEFEYSNCGVRDVSDEIINVGKHSLVVINFSKCFSFANLACENQYLGQRCDFFRANQTWDSYLEAKEGMKLRNVEWKDQFIICEDPDHPPLFASSHVYWLFSIFVCSWFLRVFLDHKVAIVNYQVEKLFGDAPPPSNGETTCVPIARVATMDSTEMEWQIQTNQLRVPSYGEATRDVGEQYSDIPPPSGNEDDYRENMFSQIRYKNPSNRSSRDAAATSMNRTRSWIREARRRSLVTSVRRSVSQLFGRPITESDDDDTTLLSNSPQHRIHPTGRPLSEAPPTYSEAMELHRILGFYDISNRFNNAEFDVVRSEHNLHRVQADSVNNGPRRGVGYRNYYRRKRPNQLRVRSQYGATSTDSQSNRLSRDAITGPAAITGTRNLNSTEFSVATDGKDSRLVEPGEMSNGNSAGYNQTNFTVTERQNEDMNSSAACTSVQNDNFNLNGNSHYNTSANHGSITHDHGSRTA